MDLEEKVNRLEVEVFNARFQAVLQEILFTSLLSRLMEHRLIDINLISDVFLAARAECMAADEWPTAPDDLKDGLLKLLDRMAAGFSIQMQ